MFLRQVRADQQQQTSDFHTLHEKNRTLLQPEDTPINENDDLYSIFDNNGNFFNDLNDSDDFYNNSGDDQETNREFNEKVYDGNKKQNHYSRNEAGPYFPNYTMLLLFLWITKHQIGLEAYRDFANIIKHPKFNPKDVPISLATIKKY
ncbi:uncharacterized protein OCT59_008154 [Rhizophagus irregularis]|uniref:uncharacterized protein n=1 Tax=Rhizophagus irregularis TaxID=588596 RepID=UPI0033289802|nr:hypothetical protein OCT59_008154 [Rhizophagus irregularis]